MEFPQFRTAGDPLEFHARHQSTRIAFVCDGRTLSYGDLHRSSSRLAQAMLSAGIAPGTRVAYLGMESIEYYEIFFACAKSATVLVPINWRLAPSEVTHILKDCGAAVLFVEPRFHDVVLKTREALPALRVVVLLDGREKADSFCPGVTDQQLSQPIQLAVGEDDAVIQLYTSGTTGRPKGAVLAHRSFFKIREGLAAEGIDWIDWRRDDVSLIAIPFFHVAGAWWAMQGVSAGVTNVGLPTFAGDSAIRLIREWKISTTLVVPAMLYMMLSESDDDDSFRSLRKVFYGGAPIAESLLAKCIATMGCEFGQLYGLTECGAVVVCLPPRDHYPGSSRMRATGLPLPGVRLKIIGSDGADLGRSAVGEICLHSPTVMVEYWGMPAATKETLMDGWLRTGDAGYLDEEGYLHVSDRIKDLIIVAGENVYPAEVENALCGHPDVVEAAVVGMTDERWGESVLAFVVPRINTTITPRALTTFLQSRIAPFKIPSRYRFIENLPRNATGKILRRQLRPQVPL